ncbi:MAG: Ig-like domain-containing protein [Balneolaceae bacterium]|nr:Ig-like domain-containing protein [Balneolaceae bacterium]
MKRSMCIIWIIGVTLLVSGCNQGTRLLNKIPVNSVEVKVLDQNDTPVQGAQVQASNGRETTTDSEGVAKVRFGSVGIHTISVFADNYMPSNFVVTMPADRGKIVTRRLTGEVRFAGLNFGAMNMYPLVFNYMFSSYGYSPQLEPYKEGQSTAWSISSGESDGDVLTMSKAFLKEMDDGKEWWGIELSKMGEDDSKYVAEILFSEDRSKILRYREKIGESEVQEKPVSEGWYTQPVSLTEESEQGAVKEENIPLDTMKGSFKADLLVFGIAPNTNLKIWKAKNSAVPGGVLKYEIQGDSELVYRNELIDFKTKGASTMLNSY